MTYDEAVAAMEGGRLPVFAFYQWRRNDDTDRLECIAFIEVAFTVKTWSPLFTGDEITRESMVAQTIVAAATGARNADRESD